MTLETQNAYRMVEWLRSGREEQQYQAALALRTFSAQTANKSLIRIAGGIKQLVALLGGGPEKPLTVVCAETVSCLIADNAGNREELRRRGGVQKLVHLMSYGAYEDCTHRALLALRILTDTEEDRVAIVKAGGVRPLIRLLNCGPSSEYTEYAAAVLGNLAAGSQMVKDALRQAGAIPPLVKLLEEDNDEISRELAAVVLRNMSLQHPGNRQEIMEAGGLQPLLLLLSSGQEKLHYPVDCSATFMSKKSHMTQTKVIRGRCCIDSKYGHLCLALPLKKLSCFGGTILNPRDKNAERYSLLRKMTISEADSNTLELNFTASEKEGVLQVPNPSRGRNKKNRRLQKITLSPCLPVETKGAIMRMLTRIHLEREYQYV